MRNPFRGPGDDDLEKMLGDTHSAIPQISKAPAPDTTSRSGGSRRPKPLPANPPGEDRPSPEMEKANTPSDAPNKPPSANLKRIGWTDSESLFNTDAAVFVEYKIPAEVKHRTLVDFQLLRKVANGFMPDASAQCHVDESGVAKAHLPIRKKEESSEIFAIQAKHCTGEWSNPQGTERHVSREAEVSFGHIQVSGIHFPVGKSFIPDPYLKVLCELKSTYVEWKKTRPDAKIIVFGHTELDEADIAGELSRNRALAAFSMLIGDIDRWAGLAEKEKWGVWEQQCMLRALGFFRAKPTGFLGPITQKAIRDFIGS